MTLASRPLNLLFVHGHFGDRHTFAPLATRLEHVAAVGSLDLPWHGAAPDSDVEDTATAAAAVIDAMSAHGFDRCVLVAHSWGCHAALLAALMAPEKVEGLVLLGMPGDPTDADRTAFDGLAASIESSQSVEAIVDIGQGLWFSPGYLQKHPLFREGLVKSLRDLRPTTVARVLRVFAKTADFGPRLARISCPVASVVFDDDAAVRAGWADAFHDGLRAHVVHLSGSHFLWLEDPDAFSEFMVNRVLPSLGWPQPS